MRVILLILAVVGVLYFYASNAPTGAVRPPNFAPLSVYSGPSNDCGGADVAYDALEVSPC